MSNRDRVSKHASMLSPRALLMKKKIQDMEQKYLKMEEVSPYKSNFN